MQSVRVSERRDNRVSAEKNVPIVVNSLSPNTRIAINAARECSSMKINNNLLFHAFLTAHAIGALEQFIGTFMNAIFLFLCSTLKL